MFEAFLLAFALQAAAPAPQPARWTAETTAGAPVLRGATPAHPGDRIIFLCNDARRLVAMLFRLAGDPPAIAARAAGGHWLLDGVAQPPVDAPSAIPMNEHIVSLSLVEPALYRQLLAAEAAGFAWTGGDGAALASYQLELRDGHAPLAEFARACDAEAYR